MRRCRTIKKMVGEVGKVGIPASPTMPAVTLAPTILSAIRDEKGGKYFCYGSSQHSVWFSASDMITDEKGTFAKLSHAHPMFTHQERNAFKKLLQDHTDFREGRLANAPGWAGEHYVLANGEVISPKGRHDAPVATFEFDQKFGRQGSSKNWIDAVGAIVADQPIVLAVLAQAFVGPLMRFVPPHYVTPMIELVGKRETGKTTLALLAASVWTGRRDSGLGGGETWKTTLNALGPTSLRHRDNLLVLDETGLLSTSGKAAGQALADGVMHLVAPQPKARMGDCGNPPGAKLAILSTSNTPLCEMFSGRSQVVEAVESRSMTVQGTPTRAAVLRIDAWG